MLLLAAWRTGLNVGDLAAAMTPAGLAGIGFFAITLLTGELAGRLAREEVTARGSLELARQQAQLNRLVIEEMADGVLVIDRRARVRAANPAARRLLVLQGLGRAAPFQLQDEPAWAELSAVVQRAFDAGHWPEGVRDLTLHFPGGTTRALRLRARFTRPRTNGSVPATPVDGVAGSEVFCVVFVEDLLSVQARTRQEKLAAMGRVSAGIAHEIRNPLAAIAQANALLAEDAVGPPRCARRFRCRRAAPAPGPAARCGRAPRPVAARTAAHPTDRRVNRRSLLGSLKSWHALLRMVCESGQWSF
jgi:two-component system sensor histidine kinase PilS (NtrC family)